MIPFLRVGTIVAITGALAGASVAGWPLLSATFSDLSEIVRQAEEAKRLDRIMVSVEGWWKDRYALKKELTRDLITGRMTLAEAVSRLRDHRLLIAYRVEHQGDLDRFCPPLGDTEGEQYGRCLLDLVILEESERGPSKPSEAVHRLNEELRLLLVGTGERAQRK